MLLFALLLYAAVPGSSIMTKSSESRPKALGEGVLLGLLLGCGFVLVVPGLEDEEERWRVPS